MADKIYKDKIGQGISQVTPPATQADHVPQFGQTVDKRLATLVSDLSVAEKDAIKTKLGVVEGGGEASGGSALDFVFKATAENRAWQGIGVTTDFIYVCSDRDASFTLNNSIQKYDHKGQLIAELTSAYTLTSPTGKFMSFGSTIHIEGGFLFIPVYDINGGGAAPYISRVAKFNADTLAYIEQFEIGNGVAESIWKFGTEYFVCYFDIMKIRKFNASWVQQAEYILSPAMKPDGGYQAIFEEDGFWYMNWHGSNDYMGTYTPGLDKYSFDGTTFTFIENLDAPTYGSGQGVVTFDGKYYWVDRPADKIIITTKLDVIVPVQIEQTSEATLPDSPTFTNLTVTQLATILRLEIEYIKLNFTQRLVLESTGANSFYQQMGAGNDGSHIFQSGVTLKFLIGYDAVPEGFRIYNYAQASPVFFNPNGSKRIGLNGITSPASALEIDGGIKIKNDTDAASATKVGTIRYRADSNNSYCEMCMQTGSSTYAWVIIKQNTW